MRAKLCKIWLPYCVTLVLALGWLLFNFPEGIKSLNFWAKSYQILLPVISVISVFSAQNIIFTPFTTHQRARMVNFAVLAAWGVYLSVLYFTAKEGHGYVLFGLQMLIITAIPIVWIFRKRAS